MGGLFYLPGKHEKNRGELRGKFRSKLRREFRELRFKFRDFFGNFVQQKGGAKYLGHTPSMTGTFQRNSGKFPETLSELSRNSPPEYSWEPPSRQFKTLEASRAFPELSPPLYGWGCLFFEKWFRRAPLRAGHGIPTSTEGISGYFELLRI